MKPKNSKEKRKFIAISVIIAVVVIGVLGYAFFIRNITESKKILIENSRLSKEKVRPGENVSLSVTIINSSNDNDANDVSVKIISPSLQISLKKDEYSIGIVGAGGSRSMNFSISVLNEVYKGRYRIKIKTDAAQPFESDTADVYLKVSGKE